jgi:carboxyl-terminal processing protease
MRSLVRLLLFMLMVALLTGFSYVGGYSTSVFVHPTPQQTVSEELEDDFRVFWEAWRIVQDTHYGAPLPATQLTYGAIQGALFTLGDPYTWFADPGTAERIREDATGRYSGIGAVVNLGDVGRVVIAQPFPGGPADEGGLLPGDVVLEVDGRDTLGLSLEESVSMIRGPAGTTVRLLVQRRGLEAPFEVEIVRREIEVPVVEYEVRDDGIAYLKVSRFGANAPAQVHQALAELVEGDPKGLILDLRENPGGFLSASIQIASEFVPEGVIVLEKGSNGLDQEHMAQGDGLATELPLAVLVNGGTASAAEIVAGAIRDHERGVLIGEQTHGKGSVQSPVDLSDGSHLRLTIAHWFTPNGQSIAKEGLVPDIEVARSDEDLANDRDPQLDEAVRYLLGR